MPVGVTRKPPSTRWPRFPEVPWLRPSAFIRRAVSIIARRSSASLAAGTAVIRRRAGAVTYQSPAGVVDDDGRRDAVPAELPRREAGPLVARPRLVDPDMHGN